MAVGTLHILGGDFFDFTYNLYVLNAYCMSGLVHYQYERVNG